MIHEINYSQNLSYVTFQRNIEIRSHKKDGRYVQV